MIIFAKAGRVILIALLLMEILACFGTYSAYTSLSSQFTKSDEDFILTSMSRGIEMTIDTAILLILVHIIVKLLEKLIVNKEIINNLTMKLNKLQTIQGDIKK